MNALSYIDLLFDKPGNIQAAVHMWKNTVILPPAKGSTPTVESLQALQFQRLGNLTHPENLMSQLKLLKAVFSITCLESFEAAMH